MRQLGVAFLALALGACAAAPAPTETPAPSATQVPGPATSPAPSVTPFPSPTESTAPTPSVVLPPEPPADLEMAIAIRQMAGLEYKRAWVSSVQSDPASVLSSLGILVTTEELVEAEKAAWTDRAALTAYGMRHAESFGGLYIDLATRHPVLLFTDNIEEHQARISQLPQGASAEARLCKFTEAALRQIIDNVDWRGLQAQGIQLMSAGLDTINNVVTMEAKAASPSDAKQALEAPYGGMVVATVYPLPGPWANKPGGDGWVLVSAVERPFTWAYTVHIARSATEWSALWAEMSPGLAEPEIDFGSSIAAVFGEGHGSGCPEVRLDDVVIDIGAGLIFDEVSDPMAPRICTADLSGAAVFVVAIARDGLPAVPFTLQIESPPACCLDAARITVDHV